MIGKYINKNRINRGLNTLIAGMLLAGCVDGNGLNHETSYDRTTIMLGLSTEDLTTKTVTGDETFTDPEKKLNSVDLYFFDTDATEDTEALKWVRFTDKKHSDQASVTIPNDSIAILFGSDNKCRVYAVVNVSPEEFETSEVDQSSPTLRQLREMRAKTTTFAETFNGIAMFTKDENGDEITYDDTNRTAEGTVKVKNLASKIDIFVNFGDDKGVVEGVDPTGNLPGVQKWKIYDGAKNEAYIVNGVHAVPLKGWSDADYTGGRLTEELSLDDYFDTRSSAKNHFFEKSSEKDKDKYPWVIKDPFYSYPNQWTNDALEQHPTYLMVKVNWLPEDQDENAPDVEDKIVETYYKVPMNMEDGTTIKSKNKLLSNVYYRVKIHINTLGGINYGEPVELKECSWEALNWGESRLDAEIHEIRWLDVSQKQQDVNDGEYYEAVMYNTSTVTIPFNTTHKVKLSSVTITYNDFYNVASTSGDNAYDPVERSVLQYRVYTNTNKRPYEYSWNGVANGTINTSLFLLDAAKLAAYEAETSATDKEPQGIYIDDAASTLTLYHSLYCLREDSGKGRYFRAGIRNYSPYTIKIVLCHEDDPSFKSKEITIKQYPGVYVEFTKNTGRNAAGTSIGRRVSSGEGTGDQYRFGIYVNGGATGTLPNSLGNIFDESNPSNCLQLGGIGGKLAAGNNNQNMYSIHVTQLSDEDRPITEYGSKGQGRLNIYGQGEVDVKFHVGDPRTKFYNNNLAGASDLVDEYHEVRDRWTATSYATGTNAIGNNKDKRNAYRKVPATKEEGGAQRLYPGAPGYETSLCYYYPTAEGQLEEQGFMVAPVFRLASGKADLFQANLESYTSDNLIRENARRRCASFQENGFPAGRWRLPTTGEMYFFRMLYYKAILPDLFGSERAYWTNQFVAKFRKDNNDIRPYPVGEVSEKHVRCVYDDWYWKKSDNATPDLIAWDDPRVDVTGDYERYNIPSENDKRNMFVWGDKLKANPQDQPQDRQ